MASLHRYQWQAADTLVRVCSRFLEDAGYSDIYAMMDAVRSANSGVQDWGQEPPGLYGQVQTGMKIIIPYTTS